MGVFAQSFSEGIRPSRDLTVSEWAEEYLYMPANTSDAGKFSIHRAPFQKEIMDSLTPGNGIEEVVWMASAQTGKTFVANAFQGYVMHIYPQNILVYQPTTTLAEVYSDSKVTPMIESTPVLKELFTDKKNNGKTLKKFREIFTIEFLGAGSGNSFRMRSAPFVIADEVDSYPPDVDGEGDPLKLIRARTTTFGRKAKLFYPSTPTLAGMSAIEKKFKEGDQRYYFCPCPYCNSKQVLKFYQLKFERDEAKNLIPESIYYECEVCKAKITEDKKTWMLAKGEWIPQNPNAPKTIRSYHISALYSPSGWYSFKNLIEDFLQAKDDPFLLKAFKNTRLGETYEEKATQPSSTKLQARAEDYALDTVNEKAVVLYAGVDTQPNRLCILVVAIGEDGESWIVNYQELPGSPSEPDVWEALERVVKRPYKHKSGVELFIKKVAVDSGGRNTTDVYNFVRKNQDKYFAIKGASTDIGHFIKESNRVDFDPKTGRKMDDPLVLYLVNTQLIKKYIYTNLNMMLSADKTEGARVIHFSNELPSNFYEMLVAEKLVRKIIKGTLKEEWVKKDSDRNESLDTLVYAFSLGFMDNMQKLYSVTYQKVWDINIGKRIELLEKKNEEAKEPAKTPSRPPQKQSWINKGGWSIK